MKKAIIYLIMCFLPIISFGQIHDSVERVKKDKKGSIYAVEFPITIEKSKRPKTANGFLNRYLKVSPNDHFKKAPHTSKDKAYVHEHFDQYYQGVKVDGAGYNFHYKDGEMYFANGNYVKIKNLNPKPSISLEEAKSTFSKYKSIEKAAVTDYITKLIIKEIKDENETLISVNLVYSIYLISDHSNNDALGYVDAHTGAVLMTESKHSGVLGTFATKYSGSKQAQTESIHGEYRLFDDSRGATIHTRSLQNNSITLTDAVEITDNDNNWTSSEHASNNNDMGLDVHWGLQEIYDYFYNTHGEISFDSNNGVGVPINAYIRYGNNDNSRDGAFWEANENVLKFGQGVSLFSPLASIDIVGHEYGHGIQDYQIGWGQSGLLGSFGEGLSDIWGVILENRISPNEIWHVGELVSLSKSYIRNIQDTDSNGALFKIADTYQSAQYNDNSGETLYLRSGVFSHWFYLLVNGGSGTNGIGNAYLVDGIDMDLAEEIMVEAVFNNYLDGITTYPAIRTAIINAASTVATDCNSNNFLIVKSVTDAWYAVGVGAAYTGTQASVTGPSLVCTTNNTYTLQNKPANTTVSWAKSANLTEVSGQSSTAYTVKAASASTSGAAWVQATLHTSCGNITLAKKNVWTGKPDDVLDPDDISGPDCILLGTMGEYHGLPWPTTVPGATSYESSIVFGGGNSGISF